jgi:hypothetical protein
MEHNLATEISQLSVANLANRPAINGDPRLDLKYFSLQSCCPRIDQRFLNAQWTCYRVMRTKKHQPNHKKLLAPYLPSPLNDPAKQWVPYKRKAQTGD